MSFSPLVDELINALRCLPGVGPKSAQRMAFQLLQQRRDGAARLAQTLERALEQVGQCSACRTLTEQTLCEICANPRRNRNILCVVESPIDALALEMAGSFHGLYFVLHGKLSPIDGIGPNEIGIPQLMERLKREPVEELILATNATLEGEATAHYIADRARTLGIASTRIAHGVPLGGELEFVDGGTLSHALSGRKTI
ncbi:MAG TPA: recombination mediator RecR [Pseudomonadales bacterium]|nr:recombination mediator RecR [Pseudomonadales bacterium]